jgi:hypothetical protein
MTNIYDRGDIVRLTANFTDINNTVADPTNITLRIKQPDASVAMYSYPGDVTKDSTGIYHFDFAITEAGDHYYRFEGSGSVTTAAETLFHVYKSNILS